MLAATRGDVGGNDTANVRAAGDVPLRVASGPLEARGEIYLAVQRFEVLRDEAERNLDDIPKNPRNLAAGVLRQKDSKKTRAVGLSFLAYDVIGATVETHREKLALLAGLGFQPIPHAVAPKHLITMAVDAIAERRTPCLRNRRRRCHGRRCRNRKRLGATSHHPRSAIAWKFQGEEGVPVLRDVQWQVARTGTITPVAIVDPVELSGVTVTRATLHTAVFSTRSGSRSSRSSRWSVVAA